MTEINDSFDDKKLKTSIHLCDDILNKISERLYLNGFSYQKISSKKRKFIFNPIFVSTFISISLIRELLSLLANDRQNVSDFRRPIIQLEAQKDVEFILYFQFSKFTYSTIYSLHILH